MSESIKSLLEDILLDYKTTWDAEDKNSHTFEMIKRIEQVIEDNTEPQYQRTIRL